MIEVRKAETVRKIPGTKKTVLGEGIWWDERRRVFHYVDILSCAVCTVDPATGRFSEITLPDTVGCIVPEADGAIAVPLRDGLYRCFPESGRVEKRFSWSIPSAVRFNDGKCDRNGRLWIGTMYLDQSSPQAHGGGALYRFTPQTGLVRVLEHMTIPNGIAFNADDTVMYHIDTAEQCVTAYDYDLAAGRLSAPRVAVRIPKEDGAPDGMTIDSDGNLFIALWGGHRVVCCDPASGERRESYSFPDARVSCCAFGGEDHRTLAVTTAADENGAGGYIYSVLTEHTGAAPYTIQT